MATVDETGVRTESLSQFVEKLRQRYQDQYGAEFNSAPESPAGGIIGIDALALAEADEIFASVAAGMSINHAAGVQLDDLASLLNITRRGATHTTVTGTLTGAPNTVVPAGARAQTSAGDQFEMLAAATIGADGTINTDFRAVVPGPVPCGEGALERIITAIAGWSAVRNDNAGVIGVNQESDAAFRARYAEQTSRLAAGPLDALRAGIIETGAAAVRIEENTTATAITVGGYPVEPHALLIIAAGTDDYTTAVLRHKSMGVGLTTAIRGDSHGTLTQLKAATGGIVITIDGTSLNAITPNISGDASFEAVATTITTSLAASTNTDVAKWKCIYSGGAFVVVRPWLGSTIALTGGLATSLGLEAPAQATGGPWIRPHDRPLVVAADVTIESGFPGDGLQQMQQALIDRAAAYQIGATPWKNDFLTAMEAVSGTRVTSLTVTDGGTDIASLSVPLDARFTLARANITITLTGA